VHRIRVYVDTSVFGGTQDDEFIVPSSGFFEQVRLDEYVNAGVLGEASIADALHVAAATVANASAP